jgi:hypothetical protein
MSPPWLRATAAPLLVLVLPACPAALPPPQPLAFPSGLERPEPRVRALRVLTEDGGFLDWCARSDSIAFAREGENSWTSEIWAIRPDGSGERCITCGSEQLLEGAAPGLPRRARRFRSHPAWHPSCEYLAIQVGGEHFRPGQFERPPFGIHADLWLVAADGSWAEPVEQVERLGGVMGPGFSERGDRLFWSARRRTDEVYPQSPFFRTPGRQNPWDGWQLVVAGFERPPGGPASLTDRRELYGDEPGIKRASALVGETLWLSLTEGRRGLVDEIFRAPLDGSSPRVKLVESRGTWEEQPVPSPWGTLVAYRSSLPTAWELPPQPLGTLRLELWALTRDGTRVQLTGLNDADRRRRVLVQDLAWGPTGEEIAIYTSRFEAGQPPRNAIEILSLNAAF